MNVESARIIYEEAQRRAEQRGRREGEQRGRREELRELFARRLLRELDARESVLFVQRCERLGFGRLGEVVLDLDAKQLAAWLANPDAT